MIMIVYDLRNGSIMDVIQDDQNIEIYYQFYPKELVDNLKSLKVNSYPRDLENYIVINDKLVKRDSLEVQEIELYGRVLTEEERLLNKLKPSPEEIKKAEQTIEILTLIQEVI